MIGILVGLPAQCNDIERECLINCNNLGWLGSSLEGWSSHGRTKFTVWKDQGLNHSSDSLGDL